MNPSDELKEIENMVFERKERELLPSDLPWTGEQEFQKWLQEPTWTRHAFSEDNVSIDSILTKKPLSELLAIAYYKSVRNIVWRTGLSYLASFTGGHRVGKSLTACEAAYVWDKTFWNNFEQRVVQSPAQFMLCIENIIKEETVGAAIVVDEAGATFSSGDWYERWLKLIQKAIQICGLLKPMILFVAPNREFIVSGMRKMITAEHHFKRFNNDFTRMRVYHVGYNFMRKGDPYYYKRPVVKIGGQSYTIKHINIKTPPDWFADRYKNHTEPEKKGKLSKFGEEVSSIIADQDSGGEPDYDTIIEDIWRKKELFYSRINREGNQLFDQASIEVQYKLKPKYAKYIAQRLERRLSDFKSEQNEMLEMRGERQILREEGENKDRLVALKNERADEYKKQKREEKLEDALDEVGDVLSSFKE